MKRVLFLCTGNYYRSRYAEIVFNWRAARRGLAWRADSRGLAPDPLNQGAISSHTLAALRQLGIPLDGYLRPPRRVTEEDFFRAHHVVAVKEGEHRPLIARDFANWTERVEFWHVHDLDCCGPEDTLPHLDRNVEELLQRLEARESHAAPGSNDSAPGFQRLP